MQARLFKGLMLFVVCVICSFNSSAYSAPPALEIFAERVEVDLKAQITHFKGNVRLLFEPYQARCQQAEVRVDPQNKRVTLIKMSGQVVVTQGKNTIKAKAVTLDVRQNKLQIQGQVYTRFQLDRGLNLNLN